LSAPPSPSTPAKRIRMLLTSAGAKKLSTMLRKPVPCPSPVLGIWSRP
jgi:hypothetical protein